MMLVRLPGSTPEHPRYRAHVPVPDSPDERFTILKVTLGEYRLEREVRGRRGEPLRPAVVREGTLQDCLNYVFEREALLKGLTGG